MKIHNHGVRFSESRWFSGIKKILFMTTIFLHVVQIKMQALHEHLTGREMSLGPETKNAVSLLYSLFHRAYSAVGEDTDNSQTLQTLNQNINVVP